MRRLKLVPENTTIDFFRWAPLTFGASVVAVVLSLIAWGVMGLNFGIDFRGGTTIRTESAQPVDVGAYRQALQPLDLGDVSITEVFDPTFGPEQNVAQIRIQAQDGAEAVSPETIQAVEAALRTVDPSITFPAVESVGPKVSGELIISAILAVLGATLGILIYIWLRFEWQFAVGAVVALVHDIIVTIGIFAVLQLKFDLAIVAALLTILGYSINDTVVVFDRVRERFHSMRKATPEQIFDTSVNETMSRTIMTSGSTLIVVVALYLFGGEALSGFGLALIIGILVGTYSTVYIASGAALDLGVSHRDMLPSERRTPVDDLP